MAVFASDVQIYSLATNSKINASYYYETRRSGNAGQVRAWVRLSFTGSGRFNNRVRSVISINGTSRLNALIKDNTSGSLGGKNYDSAWTGWYGKNANSGSNSVAYRLYDEQQADFDVTKTYNASIPTPSAPSMPSSASLPIAAPDKVAAASWGASSGGTNGVSGYQTEYSVNGGSYTGSSTTTGRSRNFDFNSIGVGHGQTFRFRVRSYSTVNGTNYYSGWQYSSTITSSFAAPSAPTSLGSIGSVAPDKNKGVSWTAPTSGGTNGVKGYQVELYVGGSLRKTYTATSTSVTLEISSYASHGSQVYYRVRAYTTGKSTNYYSGWVSSSAVTTSFVAPSVPRSLAAIGTLAPDKNKSVSWTAPSSTGSNGVSGYEVELFVGGTSRKTYTTSSLSVTLEISTWASHGSSVYYRVRAYTIGKSVKYYSSWVSSAAITTSFVAPGVVTSLVWSNSSVAPDKSTTVTYVKPSAGGSNGVSGYLVEWQKSGSSTWNTLIDTTATSATVNMATLGMAHNDRITVRVRAYTVGKGTKYYSTAASTSTITLLFVGPSNATSAILTFDTEEPIPQATYSVNWTNGSSGGTNGIKGYKVVLYINNVVHKTLDQNTKPMVCTFTGLNVDDTVHVTVEPYTTGNGAKYYSGTPAKSNSIKIVADKFIFVSVNGQSFEKHKMYMISGDGSIKEIKKGMLKVLN